MFRGVTRGWAGVLVPTLGFYKNSGLGWAKKIKGRQDPNFFHASRYSTFCSRTSNPGDAPGYI